MALNATESTATAPTAKGRPSGTGCAGSATSHNWTVPALVPLASVRPSGLNATELTAPAVRGWPSGTGCAGSATFHSWTAPSLPAASVRPLGLYATELTVPPPPFRTV